MASGHLQTIYFAFVPMTSYVWDYFFFEQMNEHESYVIVSQRGYLTTSKEHEISVFEPVCVFSARCPSLHCLASASSSPSSHLSPLQSESLPLLSSFLLSFLGEGEI